MKNLPKRHQVSIIPQKRDGQGQFKPKPNMRQPGIMKPQAIPTMLTNNNGAIGER